MVESVSRGDQDALQRLIVHYHTPLRRAVEAKIDAGLRPYLDPDDIVQQAYISAFQAAGVAELLAQAAGKLREYTRALRESGGVAARIGGAQLNTLRAVAAKPRRPAPAGLQSRARESRTSSTPRTSQAG